ncbi:SDR family NAD(P)-dependent oxidoreductase [Rhodococcus sp. WS4]|nr:SDR family NAD(P)-dependent oxidoreductase [Rhodococcus sp. WS4]
MSLFDLSGRIALVTGSSRGIGYALARGLAEAGATIVLNGVSPGRLAQAREQLCEEFGETRVHAYAFDVTDAERVDDSVARIESEVGPIEILVNNAALQHRQPLLDVTVEDWKRVIDTDLTSAFLVGRAVARFQIGRGSGKIVNVCSVQSDLRPTIAPYTTAKGGLRNLTGAMTAEWAASGLQINGLAPGYIHTEMTQALVDDARFDFWLRGRAPAGRWGTPDDLVGPTVWLASDASRYSTVRSSSSGGMTAVV